MAAPCWSGIRVRAHAGAAIVHDMVGIPDPPGARIDPRGPGYSPAVSQDTSVQHAGAEPPVYTDAEAHALDLAAELRDRVQRERTVVRRLQDYLSVHRPSPPYGTA
jgi:hypothetical protein